MTSMTEFNWQFSLASVHTYFNDSDYKTITDL